MSDNKNTLQNITISSGGISSARFTPEGMKRAVEQLIAEHQEFAEQSRSGKEQLEVKEARIFELEGRLEAKERLLEEWGVDREKMVNKISELEMDASGLKRDFDHWRADAQEWQDLMIRVCGNDTWTAQDVESHYQMSAKGERVARMSENKSPERIDLDELAVEQRNPWLRSLLRKASRYQGHLEAENRRLTADLEETQATLEDVRHDLSAAQTERDESQKLRQAVPRVITADELKLGQWIAVWGEQTRWTAHELSHQWKLEDWGKLSDRFTIVLLQDAPAEELEPVKVGDTINTEEELDSLPGGSVVLDYAGYAYQKGGDGKWWETAHPEGRDSVDVARYAPFVVLYLEGGR